MPTLCRLFSRPPDHFGALSTVRLSGECLNTRLNVTATDTRGGKRGGGGQAATQLMAAIAYSCPVLETFDVQMVREIMVVEACSET